MIVSRREALTASFGGAALAHLLAWDLKADAPRSSSEFNGGLHHPAKVRRVIQVFLNGGASQMDTFDHKPELIRRHGDLVDVGLTSTATGTPGPVMKSPFPWKRHGESGRWVTDVFPHLAAHVDDMAFLMAMTSRSNVHGPASYLQTTGFLQPGFPSCGAWVSYGLGRLTDNLPAFVVLPDVRGLPYNGMGNFGSGFLPASHQATVISATGATPIPNLTPAPEASFVTSDGSADGLRLLDRMNNRYADEHPGDSRLEARITSYAMAARMQLAAPEAFDLTRETPATHRAYGTDRPDQDQDRGFARNCLLARRLVERGVRFVQVWSGAGGPTHNWDNHGNISLELPPAARQIDQPVAALLSDLKARGLLDDTLVIGTTEFGRMPFSQGSLGRDHNGGTFVTWLAGAGIQGGVAHGQSDAFSHRAEVDPTTCHDLHATLLHLMGVDHERLTVRHNGIDRRLTDVHGNLIRPILT